MHPVALSPRSALVGCALCATYPAAATARSYTSNAMRISRLLECDHTTAVEAQSGPYSRVSMGAGSRGALTLKL